MRQMRQGAAKGAGGVTNVIGIDPATRTGYAYHWGGKWITGVFNPAKRQDAIDAIGAAVESACVTVAYVETGYLGKNPRTLIRLTELRCAVERVLDDYGVTIHHVPATTWQSAFSITGPRADRKAGATHTARVYLGAECTTQDECDAVCICEFGRRMEGVR